MMMRHKKFSCVSVNLLKLEKVSEYLLMLATAVLICPKWIWKEGSRTAKPGQ